MVDELQETPKTKYAIAIYKMVRLDKRNQLSNHTHSELNCDMVAARHGTFRVGLPTLVDM